MVKAAKALLILAATLAVFGAIALVFILPRLDFGARATQPTIEKRIAGFVVKRWIRLHAPLEHNPMAATAENLKLGRRKFDDHCAPCHAADGTAHNVFGADFSPPIPRLVHGAPGFTDGELFYVIANGIRYTAMPGFCHPPRSKRYLADDPVDPSPAESEHRGKNRDTRGRRTSYAARG